MKKIVRKAILEKGAGILTVKNYLMQFGDLDREIKLNHEQLQKLYAMRPPLVPAPGEAKTKHDAVLPDDLNAAFEVLENQYAADIKRLLQLRHDIQAIINSLDDSTHRIILTEKYINLKQPDNIAVGIPCDVRTVYRWLNDAILALQAKHPKLFEPAIANAGAAPRD